MSKPSKKAAASAVVGVPTGRGLYGYNNDIRALMAEVLCLEVRKYRIPDLLVHADTRHNNFIQQKMQGKRKIY